MNKSLYRSICICALLAFTLVSGAVAGSGAIVTANPANSTVRLHFNGADRIYRALDGTLEIVNADGHVWRYRPDFYQIVAGKQKRVDVRIVSIDKDRVSLRLGNVDPSAEVVVSPAGHPVSAY